MWKVLLACMRRDVGNWAIESSDVCLNVERTKQKHRHWSQTGNLIILYCKYLSIHRVHFPNLRETITYCFFDKVSKWFEAIDLPNQEAKTVPRAFNENWIVCCPDNLHSDQRSNFDEKFSVFLQWPTDTEVIHNTLPPRETNDQRNKPNNGRIFLWIRRQLPTHLYKCSTFRTHGPPTLNPLCNKIEPGVCGNGFGAFVICKLHLWHITHLNICSTK